jgi:hypothetical protein
VALASQIDTALAQIVALLRAEGSESWARVMERLRLRAAADLDAARSDILAVFGCMGSLNDLVLHRNGQPLIAENDALESLRKQLYELCRRPSAQSE